MKRTRVLKATAILVTSIMILSAFLVLSGNASGSVNTPSFSIPQLQSKYFKFVGNMNPDQVVTFSVVIPPVNTGLMYSDLLAISSPGSPMYHKFLTKNQIEQQFTNQNEFQNVLNYLKGSGFKIESTYMDSVILAAGTVKQIHDFLGMNVGLYTNGTATYYLAYGTPSIKGVYVYSSDVSKFFFSKPSTLVSPSQLIQTNKKFEQINPIFSDTPYSPVWFQKTYNATGLYSQGIMGQNQTIGILDFGGDPYIQEQLNLYDLIYNLPNTIINITPIGNYTPQVGVETGWNYEISLDVEISHTMAPKANITLYIANITLNLVPVIAAIDNYDSVNVLSQSFSIPESEFYEFLNASTAYYNVVLTDYYYLMGSLEGISFMASTGDAGASGYSAGPLGTVGYPSTSPWVTAMGGTTIFIALKDQVSLDSFGIPDNPASDVLSSNETAWSNYGFVPYYINYGGGTGGISMFDPQPWYQNGITLPNPKPVGYPTGRMVPDVSFEASPYPGGVFIFTNSTGYPEAFISGGTSESSPLFAGLVTLMDQYIGTRAGLLNPTIYSFGENPTLYSKLFNPVTFGYNIPYVNSYGYNLVTGFGSINIGAFSTYLKQYISQSKLTHSLTIVVNTSNPYNTTPAEFLDGSTILVTASVYNSSGLVTSGSFNVTLESTDGIIAMSSLKFNASDNKWIGNITVPQNSQGMAFLYVSGQSGSIQGFGFTQLYLGYYVNYYDPSAEPYLLQTGIPLMGNVTLINGNPVPGIVNLNITVESYSYLNNTYYTTMPSTPVTVVNGSLMYFLQANIPTGVALLETEGAYGTIPFYNGANLQNSIILGNIVAEPGVAAPGSDIFVQGMAMGPLFSPDPNATIEVMLSSTITFYLLNSKNVPISSATNNFMESMLTGQPLFGLLYVPYNTTPGYHNILIESNYYDSNLGMYINGSFYGQIYISPTNSMPSIMFPSIVYEGQNVTINVTVPMPNGANTEFGMYSATVYPAQYASFYSIFTLFIEVPLYYDAATNTWTGVAEMPSGYNTNVLAGFYGQEFPPGFYFPGTYYIYVAGQSSNGIPTNSSSSTAIPFVLLDEPYLNISSPSNGIEHLTTNPVVTITGTTSGEEVLINNVPVPINNGAFSVTENLTQGINTFTVEAIDGSGGVAQYIITVLYLPQINQIENEIQSINVTLNSLSTLINNIQSKNLTAINNKLNNLSTLISNIQSKNLTAINDELNNLTVEINTLENTFGIKLTNITNEINSLKAKLNSTEVSLSQISSEVSTTSTTASNSNDLAIGSMVVAIIAIIVAAIAIIRKNKK